MAVSFNSVPGENHRPAVSHWQTLSHNIISSTVHLAWARFELTTLVMIGTECIGSYKSNYHMIPTTMAPQIQIKTEWRWRW